MRFSFTGPSVLTSEQGDQAVRVVSTLDDPKEITTGACRGWDMAVAFAALAAWPQARHRVICPGASYDRAGVAALIDAASHARVAEFEVINLPPAGSTPAACYRARNTALVQNCDVLVAGVRSPTFYRSGEFMCINIAKRLGVPVQFEVLG